MNVTAPAITRMKTDGMRIAVVTAYDFTFARLLDSAGVDMLLVGDSLGMVIQGRSDTLPVTLDEMIYHTRCVVRGSKRAMVVADLPFGAFQGGWKKTLKASVRLMKESGCQAVKLEGGVPMAPAIRLLVERGVPVLGHVGLTPQSVHAFGGFKVQGRGDAGRRILADAKAVAEAGAFAVVLEGIPAALAAEITHEISIPTIGIGAGPGCDGQVLVCYDLLGIHEGHSPYRFVKEYLDGGALIQGAAERFVGEVRSGVFPSREHSFS